MAHTPEVTVVIPTRDRARLLPLALRSALSQDHVDQEVLVVDDGSRDRTVAAVNAVDDPRVRLVRHSRPQGVAVARNRGISEAQGEWVAFLDDDDVWAPRKLCLQLTAARSAGADWAYAGGVLLDQHMRVVKALLPPDPSDLAGQLLQSNVMPGGSSNVVVRTSLLRRAGAFDPGFQQLADWDLWIRLALQAEPAACSEVLVGYRAHDGNMLATGSSDVTAEFERLIAKHRAASEARGVRFDRATFMRFVAFGHRRAGRRGRAAAAYLRGATGPRTAGNVGRALGALLGERGFAAGRRAAGEPAPTEPEWLALYRPANEAAASP